MSNSAEFHSQTVREASPRGCVAPLWGTNAGMRSTRVGLIAVTSTVLAVGAAGPMAGAVDESSKPPRQILADARRDLAKVHSFHITGSMLDKDGRTRITADVAASARARITVRHGSTTAQLIALPKAEYVKANAAYWKAVGGISDPALLKKLAGRWVKVPPTGNGMTSVLRSLGPAHIASCLGTDLGTLAKGGVHSVGRRRAVVIVDRGDKPGTAPGRLYVALSGPALPLRATQTGPRRPGKVTARCNDKNDTTKSSDLRFSAYNKPMRIAAPPNAISPPTGNSTSVSPS